MITIIFDKINSYLAKVYMYMWSLWVLHPPQSHNKYQPLPPSPLAPPCPQPPHLKKKKSLQVTSKIVADDILKFCMYFFFVVVVCLFFVCVCVFFGFFVVFFSEKKKGL